MTSQAKSAPSRREFLASGGALALGLAAGPAFAAPDPWGGFRVGLQSYSLRKFAFPDAIKKMQELGLKHIELYPGHVSHQPPITTSKEDAKKMLADAGISADAYGVTGFKNDEADARRVFDFAKFMGLRSISADPALDSFDVLDKLVAEYNIPIAIHNHGPGHKWEKPEVILAAVKDHHPLIGLCCDAGHFLRSNIDPVHAIKVLKGRVFGFHIKDFVDAKIEASAGDARLDIKALLAEAKAQKFNGACSLEYELTPDDPISGIQKGLDNVKKAVAALG